MQKTLLITVLLFSSIQAGIFDKKFHFQKADEDIQREFPTQEKYILSYNNILEKIRTSVVNISTKKNIQTGNYANPFFGDPFFEQFFRNFGRPGFNLPQKRVQSSLGSGVIVSKDGYIVTNHHVVDGADEITVSIPGDRTEYSGKIIGTDKKSDIAVIKIEAKNLNAIKLANSENSKVGDIVFALGNPFGVGETITQGIISATRRSSIGIVEHENFIQTDASINPGNSGGALVNSAGHLIGINSAIISKTGGNVGIGFAIPSNMVINIASSLIDNGRFTRAYLGVGISDITKDLSEFYDQKAGALVTGVGEGTPAKKLGLKRGDLIIKINDTTIESASNLRNTIISMNPNTKVTITYIRDKKEYQGIVTLSKLDDENSKTIITQTNSTYKGLTLEPLNDSIKKSLGLSSKLSGVFISKVDPNSKAAQSGIRQGDIIVQIEYQEIKNLSDILKYAKENQRQRVYIMRQSGVYVVVL
jgi:serine protease Do